MNLIYLLAIYYRKRLKLHARLMVCTIFGPLIPALTRIFFSVGLADNFDKSLTLSYILIEIVLLCIIWKERNHKEVKFTYLPVLIFMALQHKLMYSAGNWDWWVSLMNRNQNLSETLTESNCCENFQFPLDQSETLSYRSDS